jgi:hypothetical protein
MLPKNLIAPLPYRISRGRGFGGLLSRQPCTQWTGWDHRRRQQWRERLGRGAEGCSLYLREERSLQYIGTDTGADAKEMPEMNARNARNEGLETPVLKSTYDRHFSLYSFSLAFHLQPFVSRFCATKRNSARRDSRNPRHARVM